MKRLTPIAMATVALGGLVVAPATAASAATATYTCQALGENGHGMVTGVQDCTASAGATASGHFSGTAVVRSRQYGFSFTCTGGVEADLPNTLIAHGCNG